MGQITILITFIWLLIAFFHHRINIYAQFFMIYLVLTKPQLSVLTLPIFLFSIITLKGWKETAALCVKSSVLLLLMITPLFVLYPAWFNDFILALSHNPKWEHPSLLHFLGQLNLAFAWTVTILLYLISLIALCKGMKKLGFKWSIAVSLALTPMVTPYIWSYDFIMVLPLFIHVFISLKTFPPVVLQSAAYLITCGSVYYLTNTHVRYSDANYWWICWTIVLVIILAIWMDSFFKKNQKYKETMP